MYGGKPYYFTGANIWYTCYLGSSGITGDRSRLKKELDTMVANGITNLHMLAASEQSSMQRSVKPAIQISAGICDDSLLVGLDFTLAEMAKRHMHAVLYLNNYWEWSGGMAQYMVWSWGGEASAQHQDGMWKQGDPFTGDPPQEPQGRNSVFTLDTSTLAIIHHHALQLQRLEIIDTMIAH